MAMAVEAMRTSARGPYASIGWFCADGTTHPAPGTPCRERGGGVQHAVRSPLARRLDSSFVHLGTILQGTADSVLRDDAWNHYRLRELVLQQFLVEVDDGWVYRQARYYRGARQIEDEEERGREFLTDLFSRPGFLRRHYLLGVQLAGVLPHPSAGGGLETQRIRNLASDIAAADSSFLRLRIKIHSFPSRDDLDAVERLVAANQINPAARDRLIELRDAMRRQYDPARTADLLPAYGSILGPEVRDGLQGIEAALRAGDHRGALAEIGWVMGRLREAATTGSDGPANLSRIDLVRALHQEAMILAQDLTGKATSRSRGDRLGDLVPYLEVAYGSGYLSARERDAIIGEVESLRRRRRPERLEYRSSLAYVARSLDWGWGTVRSTFGTVYQRYLAFEPKAGPFLDGLVRGSILLPLSDQISALTADADAQLGALHEVFGTPVRQGVRGVNPGVAMRPLTIVEPDAVHVDFDPERIYVLPETGTELRPVAGVLTLEAGNLLSHVQLLARNLGIPNASILPDILPLLRPAEGDTTFLAVTPLGRVLIKRPRELSTEERQLVTENRDARTERLQLDQSRLDLNRWEPVPLSELRSNLSGVVVGPKAANLGQLAADFPGRVAPGVALPFGMFRRHVDRAVPGDSLTVLQRLEAGYREAARRRAAGLSEGDVDAFILDVLARTRQAILDLPWIPDVRAAVLDALQNTFGSSVSAGVFVRSDTNVEDLPQFSGAGLNLTVAHQTTTDSVLASIKRVWTSPFTERAYRWRSQLLAEQGGIYPSVLLLASVPSSKSGVLITTGVPAGRPDDLTVVTAEGVGGAVEGEEAETLVVQADGELRLLSQAKAPYRRRLAATGGVEWTASDRPDYLLQPDELAQLRNVVREWKATPIGSGSDQAWDIEFGFVDGRLWLFQIRPFIGFRNSALLQRLGQLDRALMANASRPVNLDRAIP